MIPQAAPFRRIARFRREVDAALSGVVTGSCYVLGAEVEAFENEFAAYCGVDHCVGVASGTDALALVLRALRVGPGDEVITTALTAPATAQAIIQVGAIPRFVDVDQTTRCLDPASLSAALTPDTKAIVPVHLFGFPCDMPAIMAFARAHNLLVIEDCAQSHGATWKGRRVGSFGHAAAYSFYPTKNLGGIGDGGAVVTADHSVADEVRSLRNYGYGQVDRTSRRLGFNSRLDELQAAVLRVLLPHLDDAIAERRHIAGLYRDRLRGGLVDCPPSNHGCVYHQFAVTCTDRGGLIEHLARRGIATAIHYAPALHQHPAFVAGHAPVLPVTEGLANTLLSLPIQPEIAHDAVELVAASVTEFDMRCVP